MCRLLRWFVLLILTSVPIETWTNSHQSTRVVDVNQHTCADSGRYPYRQKSEYVLKELDLQPGDVVVDIGAGDGWWAERMAKLVGANGVVHASEVDQKKVDKMKEQFAGMPQIKPYLCPADRTGLPENCCDLAFLSKTYHHLENHVDYLHHLCQVVKPTGRVCVIERHPGLTAGRGREHAWCPGLLTQQAEEAGWILVRYELITGTYHYMATFVRQDLFAPQASRGRPRRAGGEN